MAVTYTRGPFRPIASHLKRMKTSPIEPLERRRMWLSLKVLDKMEPGLLLSYVTAVFMAALPAYIFRRVTKLMNGPPGKKGWN